MLALKLLLVPAFLVAVSLASRRWGPGIGGWLAGMPLVTGPILFILALERGADFTSQAAAASLAAVVAAIAFGVAYTHACLRAPWFVALAGALLAWIATSAALAQTPLTTIITLPMALISLLLAGKLFPKIPVVGALRTEPVYELPLRMVFAVLLTLFTTTIAEDLGTGWTGLVAMFPVMSTLLAVFSHRAQGPAYAVVILRGLATGLYALVAFCFTVAVLLPLAGTAITFFSSIAAAAFVQWLTKPRSR